jgi:hypothetical protein
MLWLGRGTAAVLEVALMLALVVGLASTALAANGGPFLLGKLTNSASAVSRFVGNVAGPTMQLYNTNTANNARALDLIVNADNPPMTVNASAGKATNLNADKMDGKDSTAFATGVGGKATDADKLYGQDSTAFLGASQTAADSDKLDGQDAEALKPFLADIEADGTSNPFSNTRGVVSAEKLGTGTHQVTFDRIVHFCPRVGGSGAPLNSAYLLDPTFITPQQFDGQLSTFNSTLGGNKIGVVTNDPNGMRADKAF